LYLLEKQGLFTFTVALLLIDTLPHSEYSSKLKDLFVTGRVVKVRILTVDLNPPRVVASIRQASSSKAAKVTDTNDITSSAIAEGVVAVHKTPAVPSLSSSHAHEPIPSKALASKRNSPLPQAKAAPTQSQSMPRSPISKQAAPLKVEGFSWFSSDVRSDAESDEASSDENSEEDESSKKKKRRKKKEIEQDLTADMHSKLPESNADFERLLLGSPNSSYLWVQYMSFLLQLSEIDKARETGRRAIQTISFREEEERLNVWIALLNVENVYGTDESLEAVFKDAARHNDSKTVHLRLAAILDQSEKHEASLSPQLHNCTNDEARSKQRISTSERVRSSATVRKCGVYFANITCAAETWSRHANCYRVHCKAWKSASVSHLATFLYSRPESDVQT
jgi:rRNA biogenesis protein RRP5